MPAPMKPKGGPQGLAGKKIAGVKAPIVLVGLALAIGLGLYLRARAANAAGGTSAAAPAAADTGAGSGGASGSATDPGTGLADAIWGLTGVLGSGSFTPNPSDSATGASTTAPTYQQPVYGGPNGTLVSPTTYQGIGATPQAITSDMVASPVQASGQGITIPTLHLPANTPQASATKATLVQPAAGAVSVKTLANGSKLYTYANGRQEQQVPGKSAYVVKKGS